MYRQIGKPLVDRFAALVGIVLLSPIFFVVLILLALTNSEGPFFIQTRPGLQGNVFKLLKFRTMNSRRGEDGNLLPDKDRLTTVGRVIRNFSLDEIPQLINVLKGDMSLVGPRPLLCEYIDLYSDFQRRRHEVKPGITGLAQINGRNNLDWEKRFELDVWYVDNLSFVLDLKIMMKTVLKVFLAKNVNQEGQATVEPFRGSSK